MLRCLCDYFEAPKVRHSLAQVNGLGKRNIITSGLKGRDSFVVMCPVIAPHWGARI
jgi:hypothetical protein